VTSADRLLPQVVLVIAFAGAACAAVVSALTLAVGNTEGVDSTAFLLAFAVLLPAAVVVIVRGGPLARARPEIVSSVAGVAAIGLTLVLGATRIVDALAGEGVRSSAVLLVLVVLWFAGIAILLIRVSRGLPLFSGDRRAFLLPVWLALMLVPLLVVVFASGALPAAGKVLLSLLLGAALLLADRVLRPAELIGRGGAIVVDLAVAAAILLLVSDSTVLTLDAQYWGLQLHHNTFLGPVNDVLGGRTVLVDTYAIYGVGSTYFLAGLFELVPIGYGTFGLLTAAGLAVMYAGAYAILRLAGCSQVLAVTVMAAAIASSVYDTVATPATFPSLGAIRWGFGYLLVLLALWSSRNERWAPALRVATVAIVGISSIWSFEVFVYTGITYAALVAYWATMRRPGEGWLRSVGKMLAPAVVACVAAHLALALWTLVQAGQLPDWGPYFAIVREYSIGPHDRVVAPPWWLGIPVGAFLFASAVAVGAIVSRLPRFESENRAVLLAIAGMTAFGVATFTYAVRFSSGDYLSRADLPAVMIMALWIHLAWHSGLARPARTALAITGFWLAALLIVTGWGDFEREAARAPLVAALPGNGHSVEGDVSHAWSNPAIQPRTATAETLLDRYWPDQQQALVLLFPDMSVEVLMRSGRVNLLPVSSSLADNVIVEETWERVRPVVDQIEPGTLMLTEGFYLTPGATRDYIVGDSAPLELEQLIIDRIQQRFRLEPVARERVGYDKVMGDDELVVIRLLPRGAA
jgi:hypothetical protein